MSGNPTGAMTPETVITVSLREYFESQVRHERELRESAERAANAALALQAAEYERRLADLNHEAARLKEAAEQSVPREVYGAQASARDKRLGDLERADTARTAREAERERAMTRLILLVGLIVGILSLISSFVAAFLVTGPAAPL